ncbi:class I SAM-dependent methyltransferase [Streptomyces sp. WMMC897]|uniref:class I SAM-dependent methyltransferase n=1 Tax=Streptomyces sp. WMMC897 TaxID=3014782 RepID=UPI0022B67136|nr:methyltransferase domain-containing protein [Streptomyces sp. WMMC897]MCZ7415644.1 methyltransferase domain-containing protein [Streptomyces sp. WMMC897]
MTQHDRSSVQAFFTERAAAWDARFPDDGPAYAGAVEAMALRPGDRVLDAGCGTGRALPLLRDAVGARGVVLGADLTWAMLHAAERAGRGRGAALVMADAARLPLRNAAVRAVFAAGLLTHLPDPGAGMSELARVTEPGGLLALFHPLGRAALAARHGRTLSPDDLRAEPALRPLLAGAGWDLTSYVDEEHRFLALAVRVRR